MARTYTKKAKMNTITEFSDLLSAEEMDFFPSLDLALPLAPEFGNDIDDVFHGSTTKDHGQEFSAHDILQELNFEGGDKLLETDWLTQKFDFSSFDPTLTNTSETIQELSQADDTEFESSLADLNEALLTQPMGKELLSISIEMPTTPEQKVPDFVAVSPYSVESNTSTGFVSNDSSQSSPCSPYPDSGSESTVSLTDLLTNEDGSFASTSSSKQAETIDDDNKRNASKRATPYYRTSSPKTSLKTKVKTPAQRQRKRVQNKDAATRYRVKKRSAQDRLFEVAEGIEKENSELKDQVASISKEIEYLKNLMLEVYKTKNKQQATLLKVA